jgi:hypothetical protein
METAAIGIVGKRQATPEQVIEADRALDRAQAADHASLSNAREAFIDLDISAIPFPAQIQTPEPDLDSIEISMSEPRPLKPDTPEWRAGLTGRIEDLRDRLDRPNLSNDYAMLYGRYCELSKALKNIGSSLIVCIGCCLSTSQRCFF